MNVNKLAEIHGYINTIHPITNTEFKAFIGIFKFVVLNKNEFFSKEGLRETRLGIIVSGMIRGYLLDKNDNDVNKMLFSKMDTVGGYSSLITKQPNQLNYQALTKCTLLIANYNELLKLYDAYPNIERLARISLELKFVAKEKREIELLLLNATERYLIFKKEHPGIEQKVALFHIASYIGVTPTQLSRIRKTLI